MRDRTKWYVQFDEKHDGKDRLIAWLLMYLGGRDELLCTIQRRPARPSRTAELSLAEHDT